MPSPVKPKPPKTRRTASSHRNWNRTVATSDAQSMPLKPGRTRRSGFTIQSVSAITAWPSGLRNGARITCIAKRSSSAYVKSPNDDVEQVLEDLVGHEYVTTRARRRVPSRAPAAAFTAATNFAFTACSSSTPTPRSVVPPFDVTCARSVAGRVVGRLRELDRAGERRVGELARVLVGRIPSSRAASSSAFEEVERVRGTAARDAGDGVEHVLALDPDHVADGLEHAARERAARHRSRRSARTRR